MKTGRGVTIKPQAGLGPQGEILDFTDLQRGHLSVEWIRNDMYLHVLCFYMLEWIIVINYIVIPCYTMLYQVIPRYTDIYMSRERYKYNMQKRSKFDLPIVWKDVASFLCHEDQYLWLMMAIWNTAIDPGISWLDDWAPSYAGLVLLGVCRRGINGGVSRYQPFRIDGICPVV